MFFLFRRAPTVLPAAFLVLATGCTWTPPAAPQSGADPADAQVQVRPVIDTGVIGPYQSLRPVTPGSWREQNERVAPQPQP